MVHGGSDDGPISPEEGLEGLSLLGLPGPRKIGTPVGVPSAPGSGSDFCGGVTESPVFWGGGGGGGGPGEAGVSPLDVSGFGGGGSSSLGRERSGFLSLGGVTSTGSG